MSLAQAAWWADAP